MSASYGSAQGEKSAKTKHSVAIDFVAFAFTFWSSQMDEVKFDPWSGARVLSLSPEPIQWENFMLRLSALEVGFNEISSKMKLI